MSISLLIKGNKTQAKKAARARGIRMDVIREAFHREGKPETVALAQNVERNAIVKWFAETDHAPFPVGTLLLFTDLD